MRCAARQLRRASASRCSTSTRATQGIVHVIGPELGLTQPGMTIVCGDSHTTTHGAFGALAFGIGTSEVEHVLATQCLVADASPRRCACGSTAQPGRGRQRQGRWRWRSSARSAWPAAPATSSSSAATPCRACRWKQRMTLCNMSIEAGAPSSLVAPDETDLQLPRGPAAFAPAGAAWPAAVARWRELVSRSRRAASTATSASTRRPSPRS